MIQHLCQLVCTPKSLEVSCFKNTQHIFFLKDLIRSQFIVPQLEEVQDCVIVFDNSQVEMNLGKEVGT